ncbi:MAG: hypothetical protein M0002_13805 [Rhodospirillales bacterium]|nr:hypothetical protein [Rhodospirillales bacterium]
MSPAELGEMIQAGFAPRELDEMDLGEITSWRAVMEAYADRGSV